MNYKYSNLLLISQDPGCFTPLKKKKRYISKMGSIYGGVCTHVSSGSASAPDSLSLSLDRVKREQLEA